jgi:DNA-binding IclR family transcriptional regulator
VIEGVICVGAAIPASRDGDPPLAVSFTLLAPRADARTLSRLAADLRTMVDAIADGLGRATGSAVAG